MASQGTFLLVAIDPSDPGSAAVVDEAAALAKEMGQSVRLLAACPKDASRSSRLLGLERDDAEEEEAKAALLRSLERFVRPFELNRVPVRCVVGVGEPEEVVLERARLARLVVVGTHAREGLNRLWNGSVAEEIIRHSPTPVVVVRTDGD